ncbi:MAG: C1 family peptidase, partial [Bacteroidales bacterium]
MNKFNGCIQSEQDERDVVYGNLDYVCMGKYDLPKKFKLECTPVKNQGWLGSCVGQAISTIMECDAMVRYGEDRGFLSPLFVYANTKYYDNRPNQGCSPKDGMEQVKRKGICKESTYPYVDNQDTQKNIFPKISTQAIEEAKLYKPTGYAQVSRNALDVKKAVYNEHGVMICVKVFSNFESTYRGFIKPPTGSFLGNHAMAVVGYDDDLEQVIDGKLYKGFFLIKDSYGVNDPINPGRDEGYFYLAYEG